MTETGEAIKPAVENATPLNLRELVELHRASPHAGSIEATARIKMMQELAKASGKGEVSLEMLKMGSEPRIKEEDRAKVVEGRGAKMEVSKNLKHLEKEEKARVKEIQQLVDNLEVFNRIMRQAKAEGIKPDKIAEFARKNGVENWESLRKGLVDTFLKEAKFLKGEYVGKKDDELRAIVLEGVIEDPRLFQEVASFYETQVAELEKIPKPVEPKELEAKKKERDRVKETYDGLRQRLVEKTGLTEDEVDDLLKIYKGGGEVDSGIFKEDIISHLLSNPKDKSLKITSAEEIARIQSYIRTRDEISSLTTEIEDFSDELASLDSKSKDYSTNKRNLEKKIKDREAKKKTLETRLTSYKVDEKKADFYESIVSKIESQQSLINNIISNYKNLQTLEAAVEELEISDEKYQAQLAQRKNQEQEFLRNFSAIINDSVVNLLINRQSEWRGIQEQLLAKEKDELAKAAATKIRKHCSEYDPNSGRTTYNRDGIGEYMKLLANYPDNDEGLKIITAQALGLTYKVDGKDFVVRTPEALKNLSPEQQSQIEHVLANKKGEILSGIFEDFSMAKIPIWDSSFKIPGIKRPIFEGSPGALSLKEEQWIRIGKAYGEQMKAAFESTKAGKNILNQLESSHIKPSRKWEVMWSIFAILLVLGIISWKALV